MQIELNTNWVRTTYLPLNQYIILVYTVYIIHTSHIRYHVFDQYYFKRFRAYSNTLITIQSEKRQTLLIVYPANSQLNSRNR